ncbi:hypothetical protein ISCGN_033101 [Ixodes scapularis]
MRAKQFERSSSGRALDARLRKENTKKKKLKAPSLCWRQCLAVVMASSKDDCDVFIYGTEIQEGKGTRFQSVAPRIMCIQHWSVVLVYPDGNVAVCEGNPDSKTGVLTGMLSWRTLRDLDATRSNKVSLGRHTLPIDRVVSVMRAMNRDTQYALLNNNCQGWVHELLHRLGIQVPVTAFADTIVGQNLNKMANLLEKADHSDHSDEEVHRHHRHHQHQEQAAGKSDKHANKSSSKSKGKAGRKPENRAASPSRTRVSSPTESRGGSTSPPGSINNAPSGLRPLAWIGAASIGAAAAGLAILGRYRRRQRDA